MRNKVSRIFWGVFFIAAATFVVLNQMEIWTYKLGFWAIIGTIVFALSLIDGIVNRRITEGVFSVAFLLMIYAQPLHITRLVPWTILLAAILISIGLGVIFRNRFHTIVYANKKIKDFREKREDFSNNLFTETVTNDQGDHVVINQTLSDVSRYIHSKELETIDVTSKFGDVNIYLDDAESKNGIVNMNLYIMMSDLDIFVPLSWQVVNYVNPGIGDLRIEGTSNGGGPQLVINGRARFSDIKIKYI